MPLRRIFLFFPDDEVEEQLRRKSFAGRTYPKPGQAWSQVFPSRTKLLLVGIAFWPSPPNGTKLQVRVLSKDGPVTLRETPDFTTLTVGGEIIALMKCFPVGGVFPDGPYQLEVLIDEAKYALLNLRVGN